MKKIGHHCGFDIYADARLGAAEFRIEPARELISLTVQTADGIERLLLTHSQLHALHESCVRQLMYGQRSNGMGQLG